MLPASTFSLMGFVHKASWSNHLNFAGFNIGFRDNTFHAAVVVGVAVSVDNGNNRFLRTMLEVKVKCGFCGQVASPVGQ